MAANGTFTVTVVDEHEFQLDGSRGVGPYAGDGDWSLTGLIDTGLATSTILDHVVDAFRTAPVENPDGDNGVNLHILIDAGDQDLPAAQWPFAQSWARFDAAKNGTTNANFGFGTDNDRNHPNAANILDAKRLVYRYAILADERQGSSSTGSAEGFGSNDFMITTDATVDEDQKAATFMHELGHTTGLRHGGDQNANHKPNYLSIMNYTWQFRPFRGDRPAPGTPERAFWDSWDFRYSTQALPQLDETRLNENQEIGGNAAFTTAIGPVACVNTPAGGVLFGEPRYVSMAGLVDWNGNGAIDAAILTADINFLGQDVNGDGDSNCADTPFLEEELTGYNDWENLKYNFREYAEFSDGVRSIEDVDIDLLPPHYFLVTNTDDTGPGSLRQAMVDANSKLGMDIIKFRIDGGPQTIQPLSPLPQITEPLVIRWYYATRLCWLADHRDRWNQSWHRKRVTNRHWRIRHQNQKPCHQSLLRLRNRNHG